MIVPRCKGIPGNAIRFCAAVVTASLVTVVLSAVAWADHGPRLRVFTTVIPQKYFVERIGGDLVQVDVLVGPGQSPHTYEPTPKQMALLGEASLFFRAGIPLENTLISKITRAYPGLRVVDTRKGVELLTLGDHPGQHGHGKGAPDPHIWLDPSRVKIQARTICEALVLADPPGARVYRGNLAAFQADLDRLDEELRTIFAPVGGSKIYVFHPAFGYLADAYGFSQVSVEAGGKEPSARQLAHLVSRARAEGVRVVFVQPQFSRKNAQAVARAIRGAVVPIDPLPEDYIGEMKKMARTIRDSRSGDHRGGW